MPPAAPPIPLPKAWPAQTRSGLLHAVALARSALVTARGWCANNPLARARLAAENDQLRSELALVREEMRIKDARLARVPPAQRPHYPPPERLAILTLRAARGWSAEEAARRFFVTGATIANWMARLDEQGEDALVRTPTPVNRFPDVVRDLVVRLRATLPAASTSADSSVTAHRSSPRSAPSRASSACGSVASSGGGGGNLARNSVQVGLCGNASRHQATQRRSVRPGTPVSAVTLLSTGTSRVNALATSTTAST